jgi:hypothetical protein
MAIKDFILTGWAAFFFHGAQHSERLQLARKRLKAEGRRSARGGMKVADPPEGGTKQAIFPSPLGPLPSPLVPEVIVFALSFQAADDAAACEGAEA